MSESTGDPLEPSGDPFEAVDDPFHHSVDEQTVTDDLSDPQPDEPGASLPGADADPGSGELAPEFRAPG